jgi:hypothetical protein
MVPFLSVNFMIEFSGYLGSLESLTSADATATPPVVSTSVMCSLSCPPGMVGLTLSSSHGDGAGVAELQSTPMKYVALADSSLLTFSVTPFPVQLPPKGPGPERSTDVVGRGGAVLGGCVGAAVLVGVAAAAGVLVAETAGVTSPLVLLLPHAETKRAVAGSASKAQRRRVVTMVLPRDGCDVNAGEYGASGAFPGENPASRAVGVFRRASAAGFLRPRRPARRR